MQQAMPTTWAKGEGAWTEFLKKPSVCTRTCGPCLTKWGTKGQDVEVPSLLIEGDETAAESDHAYAAQAWLPIPTPYPILTRGTRLQRSQTMPETVTPGFSNQAHCPGEKTAAESTLYERGRHGSPN